MESNFFEDVAHTYDTLDDEMLFEVLEDDFGADMLEFDDGDIPTINSQDTLQSESCMTDGHRPEGDEDEDDPNSDSVNAVSALEDIVLECFEGLLDALPNPDSQGKRAETGTISVKLVNRGKVVKNDGLATKTVYFPQNSKSGSSSSFAQVLRAIDLIHEALTDGVSITKRDMYYRDVSLFKKQSAVDKWVDDTAATVGVGRGDLNVRASLKGLFCGAGLTIHLKSGEILRGHDSESTLIPIADDIEQFEMAEDLSWVLVVEKDAVFQTLLRLRFSRHSALPGWGIIITGKGYPDVATRQLVCTLVNNLPETIPMLAVVDGDAHGIDILSVYKYGSHSMAHERGTLAAPKLAWAGIFGSELARYGVQKDDLLHITRHDEKKARSLLARPDLPLAWKRELQYILFSRRKAEIEILASARWARDDLGSSLPSGNISHNTDIPLTKYLVDKLSTALAGFAMSH